MRTIFSNPNRGFSLIDSKPFLFLYFVKMTKIISLSCFCQLYTFTGFSPQTNENFDELAHPIHEMSHFPEQMDIDLGDQLTQLDQYLQYPYSAHSNWGMGNNSSTVAVTNYNAQEHANNSHRYPNPPYFHRSSKCESHNFNGNKNMNFQNPSPTSGYQLQWQQQQVQYIPSYQQSLTPRDAEKSYACSNIY